MGNPENNPTQTDYISRIHAVFDCIEKNLDSDISLDELARISFFSKYNFSRIFDAMVSETPFGFIKRVRLEKAASLLRIHPNKPLLKFPWTAVLTPILVKPQPNGEMARKRTAITVKPSKRRFPMLILK